MNAEVVNTDQPASQIVEILQDAPANGAEEQKPDQAAAADDKNAEGKTPEQLAEEEAERESRRTSRRQRAREREVARLAAAETETRILREKLDAQAKPQVTSEPKREEFDSLEDYHRALAKHEARLEARQTIETERKERQEQESKARTADTDKKVAEAWSKGEDAFRKEAKDYDEVVAEFVDSDLSEIDPTARRAILESEVGQRVLYHLAKNPDEAERIAKLSPTRQVIEIGKLEDKVNPPKKQSSAPAPVSGVKGSSATHNITGNETQAEYEAKRKAQGNARWAR